MSGLRDSSTFTDGQRVKVVGPPDHWKFGQVGTVGVVYPHNLGIEVEFDPGSGEWVDIDTKKTELELVKE